MSSSFIACMRVFPRSWLGMLTSKRWEVSLVSLFLWGETSGADGLFSRRRLKRIDGSYPSLYLCSFDSLSDRMSWQYCQFFFINFHGRSSHIDHLPTYCCMLKNKIVSKGSSWLIGMPLKSRKFTVTTMDRLSPSNPTPFFLEPTGAWKLQNRQQISITVASNQFSNILTAEHWDFLFS